MTAPVNLDTPILLFLPVHMPLSIIYCYSSSPRIQLYAYLDYFILLVDLTEYLNWICTTHNHIIYFYFMYKELFLSGQVLLCLFSFRIY